MRDDWDRQMSATAGRPPTGPAKRIRIGDRVFRSGRGAARFHRVTPGVISRALANGRWRGMRVETVED